MFEKLKLKLNKNHSDPNCLKCQYNELFITGKKIFAAWDQKGKPPKALIDIQKKLLKLKKEIETNKLDAELVFCANHPEVFEFVPIEWT